MKEKKNFWDRNARIYNRFTRKDRAAYETMYALIVSNALHIMPQPEKALREIRRVPKDETRADCADIYSRRKFVFRQSESVFYEAGGISPSQQVDERGNLTFLQKNGWAVRKSVVLKASFPLTYTECVKSEV